MSKTDALPTKDESRPRHYCRKCRGLGYIGGLERACPNCNPGGEWRAIRRVKPEPAAAAEAAEEKP